MKQLSGSSYYTAAVLEVHDPAMWLSIEGDQIFHRRTKYYRQHLVLPDQIFQIFLKWFVRGDRIFQQTEYHVTGQLRSACDQNIPESPSHTLVSCEGRAWHEATHALCGRITHKQQTTAASTSSQIHTVVSDAESISDAELDSLLQLGRYWFTIRLRISLKKT